MGLLKVLGIGKYLKKVKEYVDEQIKYLVGSAPDELNTIHELAEALKGDGGIVDKLDAAINNKADKSDIVQSDWNQNDTAANDYIKNRPFCDEIVNYSNLTDISLSKNEDKSVYCNIDFQHVASNGILLSDMIIDIKNADPDSALHVNERKIISKGTNILNKYEYIDAIGYDDNGDFIKDGIILLHIVIEEPYTDNQRIKFNFEETTGEMLDVLINITFDNTKQLNEKYIPSTIARYSDIELLQTENEDLKARIEYLENIIRQIVNDEYDEYYKSFGTANGETLVDSEGKQFLILK